MVPGKRRAPVFEHPRQPSSLQIVSKTVLREVGQPETVSGGLPRQRDIVDRQLSVDTDVEGASAALEFPHIEPAMGREAQVDAAVIGEIVRGLGWRAASQI